MKLSTRLRLVPKVSATELEETRQGGHNSARIERVIEELSSRFSTEQDETEPILRRRYWKKALIAAPILLLTGAVWLFAAKQPSLLPFSNGKAARSAPEPRLQVQGARGISGEPLRFTSSIQQEQDEGAAVIITGLIPGMTFSTGSSVNANTWQIPSSQLAETWIGPPAGFIGGVDLVVELHLTDKSIIDRKPVHFEWTAVPSADLSSRSGPSQPSHGPDLPAPVQTSQVQSEAQKRIRSDENACIAVARLRVPHHLGVLKTSVVFTHSSQSAKFYKVIVSAEKGSSYEFECRINGDELEVTREVVQNHRSERDRRSR